MATLPLVTFQFRAAHYVYWAMSAAFLGFYTLYFENIQRTALTEIGWMMSIYVGAALVGQYAFGFASDKLQSIRGPVLVASGLFAAAVAALPFQSEALWIRITMALIGFSQQPIGPMLDSWTLKMLHRCGEPNRFGQIRSFGSLGWATIALLTAHLILWVSWNMLFVVAVAAALLLCLVVLTIPEVGTLERAKDRTSLTLGRSLTQLFSNPAYVYILAVVFLMYLGVQTTFNFQGKLIKDAGGGVADLGWTFFFGVMSEMPAMFLAAWLLPRWPARKLMIAAALLYMARYALILYFQTPRIVMFAACLEGVAFGLLLSSLRSYVFAVVGEETQTLAMTVVDATFLGLTVIVGGVVGGWLIERFSVFHMVGACAASSGLALLLLFAGEGWDRFRPAAGASKLGGYPQDTHTGDR